MTEESKVIYKSKSFVLGYCNCPCKEEIPLRSKHGFIQKFKNHHNINLHNRDGPDHSSWKGGRRKSHKYFDKWYPDHPLSDSEGYIKEHRYVYEQYHKCCVLPWIVVHHKNNNPKDNRPENLQTMTKPEHHRHHRLLELAERRKEIMSRVCGYCGSNKTPFNKRERFYIWKRHPKDKTKWLCNKCYIKYRRGRIVI